MSFALPQPIRIMSTINPARLVISKSVYLVILTVAWAWLLQPITSHAQAASSVTVVEQHIGGAAVYCLRNGGRGDATVTVSYRDLASGQRVSAQISVAPQTFSAAVTTSASSTKPLIISVQYSLPQSSNSLRPAATP